MPKLFIKTRAHSIVLIGEFCDWDMDKAKRYEKKPRNKHIVVDDMQKGEYRVLNCKSYLGGEIYPTDGRQMSNRYFSGEEDEKIIVHFMEA